MSDRYDQYWQGLWATSRMRRAVVISLAAHCMLVVTLVQTPQCEQPIRPPNLYQVQLISVEAPEPRQEPKEAQSVTEPEPEPEPEPSPEPEPKPKPTPKPTPEPKPEPKPAPKPIPEAKPKREPDAEPKPNPEPKPAPPKEAPAEPGITMQHELPSVLSYWSRSVQRKVEARWQIPGGIRLDSEQNEAAVSFWVNRRGNLTGDPEIVKHARDKAVGLSAVRAIQLAEPFPPLPDDYPEPAVQVVYTFNPIARTPGGGDR